MIRAFSLFLLISVLIFAGCSDDSDSLPTGPGSDTGLAVVNTGGDDEANISVIDYVNGAAWNDLLPVNGTCEMAQYGDDVYIVDKNGDRVIKFDPVNRVALGEVSTGPNTAPNSIAFLSATKAYVTMSDSAAVKIIDPSALTVTGSIDISAMADDDGDPDAFHAVIKDGRLYVALRRSQGRNLSDYSSIAVINTATDTVIGEIVTAANGIAGSSMFALGGTVRGQQTVSGTIYPYVIGSVSNPADGDIEVLDAENQSVSTLMTESEVGGNILVWVFDSNSTGWAMVGLSDTSGGTGWGLRRFNLGTKTFTPVSSFQESYYSWALDFTDGGLVLVGSSDEDNPGVLVFDANNNYEMMFDAPIDTGLLPKRLLVVR